MAQRFTYIMGHWFQHLTEHTSCYSSWYSPSSSSKAVKSIRNEEAMSQLAPIELLHIIRKAVFCHALLLSGHIAFIFSSFSCSPTFCLHSLFILSTFTFSFSYFYFMCLCSFILAINSHLSLCTPAICWTSETSGRSTGKRRVILWSAIP